MNNDYDELFENLMEEKSFTYEFYRVIAARVKKFLSRYYQDSLLNLEPEAYQEIETILKEDLLLVSDSIPDILYRNNTIKDREKEEEALKNFVPDNKPINWPVTTNWFDKDYSSADTDDDDRYIEDSNPFDLTSQQKEVKELITIADEILENTRDFAHFTGSGYRIINKEIHLLLENNAAFDLSILSAEGYIDLQNHINTFIVLMLEDLYSLMPRS
jgi:hypothetical protein